MTEVITPGVADLVPAAPGGVSRTMLPGGLRVLTETVSGVRSVSLGIWVTVGSRDETADINGVSHFLEHMMFKGSEKYSWEDVNRIFDEIGARYKAGSASVDTLLAAERGEDS